MKTENQSPFPQSKARRPRRALSLLLGAAFLVPVLWGASASSQPPEEEDPQPVVRPGLVQPGVVQPEVVRPELRVRPEVLENLTVQPAQGRDSTTAGARQRNPKVETSRGQEMKTSRLIRETDHAPAAEIDPAVRRELQLRRDDAPMTAVLGEWERRGRPAAAGPLPPVDKVREIPVSRRPDPPRANLEVLRQERLLLAREQQERARGKTHLRLVLRVTRDGGAEVVSATEFDGGAFLSSVPSSDYIWAVQQGDRTLAAEALPDNPFEIHSFGGPEDSPNNKGHHFQTVDEATVVVRVPDVTLEEAMGPSARGLEVALLRVEPGPALERIDNQVIQKLRQEQRVRILNRATGLELAPGIREHAVRKGLID